MLGALPLVTLLLAVCAGRRVLGRPWREAILLAAIGWGTFLTALTEILGYLDRLRTTEVALAWVVASCGLAILALRATPRADSVRSNKEDGHSFEAWSSSDRIFLGYLAFVVGVTGLVAVIAPPNMFDLLTYHMTRVVHWIQNGNVSHFPAHNVRQVYITPWPNFAALHFQLLSGGDHLANLPAWLAMTGTIVSTSIITKELGATRRTQLWSAVIAASLPSGIIQGSSGQADAIGTFWLTCFVWAVLRTIRSPQSTDDPAVNGALGGSLGLALLSKLTAYFFALPFLVWICIAQLRARRSRGVSMLASAGLLALSLNAPFYLRNIQLFGDPLRASGTTPDLKGVNADLGPRIMILGPLRQASLHWGSPGRLGLKSLAEGAVRKTHLLMGVSADDPGLSFPTGPTFEVPPLTLQDSTGNNVHFVVAFAALILLGLFRQHREDRKLRSFTVCTVLGFVVFSYVVRWHSDNARYHLPTFVLCSAIIAIALASIRRQQAARLVPMGLALASLPWLVSAQSRPLLRLGKTTGAEGRSILTTPRFDMYFGAQFALRRETEFAADFIRTSKCTNLGIVEGWNDIEYPLWMRMEAPAKVKVHHVLVDNATRGAIERPARQTMPCVLLVRSKVSPTSVQLDGLEYRKVASLGSTSLLAPAVLGAN